MGGTVPKPTALKIREGVRKDRINHKEPKPEPGIPEPPAHYGDLPRAMWFHIAGLFNKTGVLTKSDAIALEMMVDTYFEMRYAQSRMLEVDENKPYIIHVGDNGVAGPSAYYKAAKESRAFLLTILREFGGTPASRTKIRAEAVESDPLDEFDR